MLPQLPVQTPILYSLAYMLRLKISDFYNSLAAAYAEYINYHVMSSSIKPDFIIINKETQDFSL